MDGAELEKRVGAALASAFATKGYDTLTAVQEAVLDPALDGRDLRITSQTGSGKTIAIGFAVRGELGGGVAERGAAARPRVLVLAPTREHAKQVGDELAWLYAPLGARVAVVTGGAGYVDQKRALASHPAVVVATPGRLRDVLERGKIDPLGLSAVVLDEADSMLDLGFREDLDAILVKLPSERRSHLVSATFSRDVLALADRFQRDPVHVQGTRFGDAHADIEHVVHLVEPAQRVDALINLLLFEPDAKSLVFARTRADVARIAGELAEAGFVVRTLSGEMEQPQRDRALAAFRQGGVQALVATDVAARGIDVRDVARVIQIEPPSDVETYTHRSGRTGRAGKQGTSVLFVSPSHYAAIARGLARAKIAHRVDAIPGPRAVQEARERQIVAWLARDGEAIDPHAASIAERIVASEDAVTAVARLVLKAGLEGPTQAREIRAVALPAVGPRAHAPRPSRYEGRGRAAQGRDREEPVGRPEGMAAPRREPTAAPRREAVPVLRREPTAAPRREAVPVLRREPTAAPRREATEAWVTFRMTWGSAGGADPRRVLAVACRRGEIRGADVGAIRIEPTYSLIDVARDVAPTFEKAAARPDPRDPRIRITPDRARLSYDRAEPSGAERAPERAERSRPARSHPGRSSEHADSPYGRREPQRRRRS